jgi:hypothetical protein
VIYCRLDCALSPTCIFFLTLSGISCVTLLKYTLILSPQFTKSTENFHDRQSSERCIRKLISRHCLDKTRTRWNDFLFLITDDPDFRPQTCTNGLVFRECKHIKNIFEDVYFTKNSFHITLISGRLICLCM